MQDMAEFTLDLEQTGSNTLDDLGLTSKYSIHLDVINNETGFALYMDFDHDDGDFYQLYEGQGQPESDIHHTDFDPTTEGPISKQTWPIYVQEMVNMTYLLIRELDENGNPGEWQRIIHINYEEIVLNNPSDTLIELGFDRFGSVTWFSGLEENKQYQIKMWIDTNQNGEMDTEGYYTREAPISENADGTGRSPVYDENGLIITEESEYYRWIEPDLVSDIHDINTNPDTFDLDIDGDGTMDFFANIDVVEVDTNADTSSDQVNTDTDADISSDQVNTDAGIFII